MAAKQAAKTAAKLKSTKFAEEHKITVELLSAKEAAKSVKESMELEKAIKLALLEKQNSLDKVDKEREYNLKMKAMEAEKE